MNPFGPSPIPASYDAFRLCHVTLSYVNAASFEGTLTFDLFSLGASYALCIAFSCMAFTYSSTTSDPAIASMLDMNKRSLSLVSQTNTHGFSYCISDHDFSRIILLGHSALLPPPQIHPLVKISLPLPYFNRIVYSVQLEGIHVGSILFPIPKSILLLDHTGASQIHPPSHP